MKLYPTFVLLPLLLAPLLCGCGASTSHTMETSLRVMSLNVRFGTANDGPNSWPHRRDLLLRTIHTFRPDLLGAQEAVAFQINELREALPEYGFLGVGRDDGHAQGEFSPVFYRMDRFERTDSGYFWLSETPDAPGSRSWDSSLPRLATWVRLRDRRNDNRELLFVNTHWDHAGSVARLRSAELIRRRVARMMAPGPVILTGDLNCTEDDEPHAVLLGRGDDVLMLLDSYRVVHPERLTDEATFHGFQGTTAGSRIDFVFHTRDFVPVEASIDRTSEDGRFPTDHYPVTAVLRWSQR